MYGRSFYRATSSKHLLRTFVASENRCRKGKTKEVDWKYDEPAHVSNVPEFGINTARLYEAFATGDEDGYASIESARKVHHLIDRVIKAAVWAP